MAGAPPWQPRAKILHTATDNCADFAIARQSVLGEWRRRLEHIDHAGPQLEVLFLAAPGKA
jgi:hypothetical protein